MSEEVAQRIEKANGEARDLLREIHSASKDLRAAIKEARELAGEIQRNADEGVEKAITLAVTSQLEETTKVIKGHMDLSVIKVGKEFEKLERLFLGLDHPEPLEGLIRGVVAKRNQFRG